MVREGLALGEGTGPRAWHRLRGPHASMYGTAPSLHPSPRRGEIRRGGCNRLRPLLPAPSTAHSDLPRKRPQTRVDPSGEWTEAGRELGTNVALELAA